jgi:DNA polymerase elongation subunit (family B)
MTDVFIIDWHEEDIENQDDESSSDSSDGPKVQKGRYNKKPAKCKLKYLIRAFGQTTDGTSITLNIHGFRPYFYIKVPDKWNNIVAQIFIESLKEKVYPKYKQTLTEWKLLNAKPFYFFTGKDKFKFIRLVFTSKRAFYQYKKILEEEIQIYGINGSRPYSYQIYESNISPLLRFIHGNNLKSIGWVHIEKGKYSRKIINDTTCELEYDLKYKDVIRLDKDEIAPIKYVAFDIEADSSHGDFPIAKKNYQKLARDIISEFLRLKKELYKKDYRKTICLMLKLAFNPYFNNNNIGYIKTIDDIVPTEEVIDKCSEEILKIVRNVDDEQPYRILEVLASMCPEQDDYSDTSYYSLAEQILLETSRLSENNNLAYRNNPQQVIKLLINLAFNEYYNNLNINVVYIKQNAVPKEDIIECLVPLAYSICDKCRIFMVNKKKRKRRILKEGEIPITQDTFVDNLTSVFDQYLPEIKGDRVIQIGSTFKRYGQTDCYLKHIICLDSCAPITNERMIAHEYTGVMLPTEDIIKNATKIYPNIDWDKKMKDGISKEELESLNKVIMNERKEKQDKTDTAKVIVECYSTEEEVLLAWTRLIQEQDPDLVIGHNTFGFDFKYMFHRAEELSVVEEFSKLGRIKGYQQVLYEQGMSSAGMGNNLLYYIQMFGRVLIDLYKVAQTNFKLPNYKLDFISKKFLFKGKNDVTPHDIFTKQKGTAEDRRLIAEYCLIDCILCNRLIDKLDIIISNIGMAQVCSVPFSYLFLRGQGIKLLSFVSKICRQKGYLIPVLEKVENMEGKYEGAIVLKAFTDIYFQPVVVADFNSLYPSCIISENLSHDSLVGTKIIGIHDDLDHRGKPLVNSKYENQLLNNEFEGWDYVDVPYELYQEIPVAPGRKKTKKTITGYKICRFAQPPNGEKSIIPTILMELLSARKSTRKKQKDFVKGSFHWNVLEGLQVAYKVTANSLYGQMGAAVGPLYLRDIAACTTATGRKLIRSSQKFIENNYPGSQTVYGDSVTGDTPMILRVNGKTHITKVDCINKQNIWYEYGNGKLASDINNIESWTEKGWTKINRVIKHKTNKKIYRVLTHTGCVDVTEDHSLLSESATKIKPSDCTIGTKLLQSFPSLVESISTEDYKDEAWYVGDGDKDTRCDCKNKVTALTLYMLMKNIGYNVSINTRKDKPLIYRLTGTKKTQRKTPNAIKKLYEVTDLYKDQYVYDLETENHHFHAGIGNIIVHNTDSVFIKFATKDRYGNDLIGYDAVYKSIELCTEASLAISRLLKKPHNLEFEKAILPFVLVSKKRYAGHYYCNYGKPKFYLNTMGLISKRRDNGNIAKIIFVGMMKIIMEKHSMDQAIDFVIEQCKKLLNGDFPLVEFVITKTLRGYYKIPYSIAHNVLAMRIGKRDPGNKPQSNDRIAYAYIRTKDKTCLQGDRIETPQFITENKLDIDYRHYLTNQIMKPVGQIIALLRDAAKVKRIFDCIIRDYDYNLEGVQKITDMCSVSTVSVASMFSITERLKDFDSNSNEDSEDSDDSDEDSDTVDEEWSG